MIRGTKMIKLENVSKIYTQEGNASVGIRKINLEFKTGEFVAITGESGSGKTTLLNVISGIDTYEEGEMYVNGEETSYFTIEELEEYRNKYVGFIFQNYNIIDSYTVKQNVEAALLLNNYPAKEIKKKAQELIEKVGLSHRMRTKASKLSGGEKQRVVIARALAKNPLIIAADEPTGNLDSETSKQIIELLHEISKDRLVLIVTHDFEEVEKYATRKIRIFDGEIKEDVILKPKEEEEVIQEELISKPTKTKFFKMIPFGLNDMIASPKRSIFNIIVYYIMCLVVVFAFTFGFYSVSLETGMSGVNKDETRIQLKREDNQLFTDEDIETIQQVSGVKSYVKYNYYLDQTYYIQCPNIRYGYLNTILRPLSSFNDKLTYGKLPTDGKEAIMALHSDQVTTENLNAFVGSKVLNSYSSAYLEEKTEFTISGVFNIDHLGDNYPNYLYVNDAFYNSLAHNYYRYHYFTRYLYQDDAQEEAQNKYIARIFASDELEGDEFYYLDPDSENTIPESELPSHSFHLELGDALYGARESITLHAKGYLDKEEVANLYERPEEESYYSPNTYGNFYYNAQAFMMVSKDTYDKIFSHVSDSYELSVFTNSSMANAGVKARLKDLHYIGISVSELESVNVFGVFTSLLFGFVLLQFLVGIFFLVFAIMNHSVRARRGDIEIMRTIGATKGNIRTMLISEYVACGIIGYILSIITFLFLRNFAVREVKAFLAYLLPGHFVLIFLVVLALTTLMSLLFTKLIFKKSVRKGLMGARRS